MSVDRIIVDDPWRDVVGFEGLYAVCEDGRVFSYRTRKLLKPSRRGGGYLRVTLCRDGRRLQLTVHGIVLNAFVGPCPPGQESRHGDGIASHNHLRNLCWGTRLENADDKRRHGTMAKGEGHGRAKVTEAQVVEIRLRWARGERQVDLASEFGIAQTQISAIVRREHWRHVA
jgi:hypothetical protein